MIVHEIKLIFEVFLNQIFKHTIYSNNKFLFSWNRQDASSNLSRIRITNKCVHLLEGFV